MKQKFIDLHLHTSFSDGISSPEQVAEAAEDMNLSAIALTDHDTIEGCSHLEKYCINKGIEFIPGTELSVDIEGNEMHLLGYFLDIENQLLIEQTAIYQQNRINRIIELVERLNKIGIDLTADFVNTGNSLTDRVGLSDNVKLIEASALNIPFADNSFDVSYMIHVGMNIADKDVLFSEAFRVTKPGGVFGIYDVMLLGNCELQYPLPWAVEEDGNAIASARDYISALIKAGFSLKHEDDKTDFANSFFEKMSARTPGSWGTGSTCRGKRTATPVRPSPPHHRRTSSKAHHSRITAEAQALEEACWTDCC